jgi:hypothetical protein
MKPIDQGGRALRRRMVLGSLGALSASAVGLVPSQALAQVSPSIDGVWNFNGNGYLTGLVVRQGSDGSLAGSTLYGEPVDGFYSPQEGRFVLLRGPAARPTQVFLGTVSAGLLSGVFYALTPGMGATPQLHTFHFVASRPPLHYGAATAEAGPPTAVECLDLHYTAYNRPREFSNWTMRLSLEQFACHGGTVSGLLDGDVIYGHYAYGSGSLAFMRLHAGMPAQFYRARVEQIAFHIALLGYFTALTPGMGASLQRIDYDWWARS